MRLTLGYPLKSAENRLTLALTGAQLARGCPRKPVGGVCPTALEGLPLLEGGSAHERVDLELHVREPQAEPPAEPNLKHPFNAATVVHVGDEPAVVCRRREDE